MAKEHETCAYAGDCLPKIAELGARTKSMEDAVKVIFVKLDHANATLTTIREEMAEARGMVKGSKGTVVAIAGVVSFLVGLVAPYVGKVFGIK